MKSRAERQRPGKTARRRGKTAEGGTPWPAPSARLAGFSLMELLLVMLLLAVLAALAAPAGSTLLDSLAFQRQTRQIMAHLRYARLLAITSGRPVEVRLDDDGARGLRLSGAVEETRELTLTETERLSMTPTAATFFPEGMATPATLVLNTETRQSTIQIDALTGLPQIQR